MDTTNNDNDTTANNEEFDDITANDGMTASSARKSKDDADSASHPDHFDANDKPGAKFNINDQAHSQSSKEDFVKTVSNFKHEDGTTPPSAIDSQHLSND